MDVSERGEREYRALIGGDPATGLAAVRQASPHMYQALLHGFGTGMTRPELSRADRELATVAMLAALGGTEPQLAVHVGAALRAGHGADTLRALAEHVALYAGFPRGLNALAVVDRVLADAGVPRPAVLHTVRLADHDTVVAQVGELGPAVVLSHSLGLDWRMWEPVMAALAAPGRRVYAYDTRHHGAAAGAPVAADMSALGADLVGVLDALGLDRAHLVGLSMGGGIVATAALDHPGRAASVALLATSDHPFPSFADRARSGAVDGMAAQVAPTLSRWFTAPALAENGWGVRYARERLLRFDPADWAASWRVYTTLAVQERLGGLDVPTLVLAGQLDASTTPAIMTGLAGRLPSATYHELPGTPHQQTLQCPDRVAAALDAFLPADR
ncbi:MAG TPA: alpha/beta fold hydrolase [Actinocatenispora sp.]